MSSAAIFSLSVSTSEARLPLSSATAVSRFSCTSFIAFCNALSAALYAVSSAFILAFIPLSASLSADISEFISVFAALYAVSRAAIFSLSVATSEARFPLSSLTAVSRFSCTSFIAFCNALSAALYDVSSAVILAFIPLSVSLSADISEFISASAALYAVSRALIFSLSVSTSEARFPLSSATAVSRFACTSFIAFCNALSASSSTLFNALMAEASSSSVAKVSSGLCIAPSAAIILFNNTVICSSISVSFACNASTAKPSSVETVRISSIWVCKSSPGVHTAYSLTSSFARKIDGVKAPFSAE